MVATARVFFVLAWFAVASLLFAEESSPESTVLEKSRRLMLPPVRYRAEAGRLKALVYVGKLTNGERVTRTQMSSPAMDMLSKSGVHLEVLHKSEVVIDKSTILSNGKPLKDNVAKRFIFGKSLVWEWMGPDEVKTRSLRIVMEDGSESLLIQSKLLLPGKELSKLLPSASIYFDAEVQKCMDQVIDVATGSPRKMYMNSCGNERILKLEIIDVQKDEDRPDSFFDSPDGYSVYSPTTLREYRLLHERFTVPGLKDSSPLKVSLPLFTNAQAKLERQMLQLTEDIEVVTDPATNVHRRKGTSKECAEQAAIESRRLLYPPLVADTDSLSFSRALFLVTNAVILCGIIFLCAKRFFVNRRGSRGGID